MENNYEQLPEVTRRIKDIINTKFDGNVSKFCSHMGLLNSSKINRLFKKDKRNNEYPIPSTDILTLISNAFGYSLDYLVKGEDTSKHVNNINIDGNKINNGDNNVIGDISSSTDTSSYIEIIQRQQEQINNLIQLLSNGKTH